MTLIVTIEIPSWSFRKVSFRNGAYQQDFFSLVPCPFNYGFVSGTTADDGDPQDVIVIGPRLARGAEIAVDPVLRVEFLDRGRRDDKLVARVDGAPLTLSDHTLLRMFFLAYVALKRIRQVLSRTPGRTGVRGYVPV